MTSSSANLPPHYNDGPIDIFPRRRLRQYVNNMFTMIDHSDYTVTGLRKVIADATSFFGDDVVAEILRSIERDSDEHGVYGIAILRMLATSAAIDALWRIANDEDYGPWMQFDALCSLRHLGAEVNMHTLTALGNQCEQALPRMRLEIP